MATGLIEAFVQIFFNVQTLNHSFCNPVTINQPVKIIPGIAQGYQLPCLFVHQPRLIRVQQPLITPLGRGIYIVAITGQIQQQYLYTRIGHLTCYTCTHGARAYYCHFFETHQPVPGLPVFY